MRARWSARPASSHGGARGYKNLDWSAWLGRWLGGNATKEFRSTCEPDAIPGRARLRIPAGWVCLFSAVCLAQAIGAALVVPYANTEAVDLHLAEIAKTASPTATAVFIVNGAVWHVSNRLTVAVNVSLLERPLYAPELNSIENVWPTFAAPSSLTASSKPAITP